MINKRTLAYDLYDIEINKKTAISILTEGELITVVFWNDNKGYNNVTLSFDNQMYRNFARFFQNWKEHAGEGTAFTDKNNFVYGIKISHGKTNEISCSIAQAQHNNGIRCDVTIEISLTINDFNQFSNML